MARYRFLTTWVLDAPHEAVWQAIHDCERWPDWWQGVVAVREARPGAENGVGAVFEHQWRGRVPYTVRFRIEATRLEPPHLIEGAATGELEAPAAGASSPAARRPSRTSGRCGRPPRG